MKKPRYHCRCAEPRDEQDSGVCMNCNGNIPGPVRGKTIRVTRLDADGNPTGVPLLTPGSMSIEFPETADGKSTRFKQIRQEALGRFVLGMELTHVDPDVIALLFGYKFKPRPWWWRFLPKPIKHRIKRREIRRGYGG